MKKLLLASLFVIGATSFAGVEGKTNNVELPIRLKGNLVAASSTNLMIEGTTTGMAGNIMDFDFGDIQIPEAGNPAISSLTLTGTYKIWKPTGDVAATTDDVAVGFDTLGTLLKKDKFDIQEGLIGKLQLSKAYEMNADKVKSVSGVVTAQVTTTDTATPGTFFHTAEKIFVVVK